MIEDFNYFPRYIYPMDGFSKVSAVLDVRVNIVWSEVRLSVREVVRDNKLLIEAKFVT